MRVGSIDVDITRNCNLSCVYCYNSQVVPFTGERIETPVLNAMSKEAHDRLFNYVDKSNIVLSIALMGGEPFLEWEIISGIVSKVDSKHKITIVTNCSLIKEEQLRFLTKYNHIFCDVHPTIP